MLFILVNTVEDEAGVITEEYGKFCFLYNVCKKTVVNTLAFLK